MSIQQSQEPALAPVLSRMNAIHARSCNFFCKINSTSNISISAYNSRKILKKETNCYVLHILTHVEKLFIYIYLFIYCCTVHFDNTYVLITNKCTSSLHI